MPVRNSDSAARQVHRRVRDVVGLAEAGEVHRLEARPALVGDVGVAPLVEDVAGADRVAADAVGRVVDRDRPGEPVQPGLARDVRGEARARALGLAARDVDDRRRGPRACMCGIAARHSHIGAVRLTRSVSSQAAVVSSADRPSCVVDRARDRVVHEDASSPPSASAALGHQRCTPPRRPRSASDVWAVPPRPDLGDRRGIARSASRPVTTTSAPSAANRRRDGRPMPGVDPVTSAISPASRTVAEATHTVARLPACASVMLAMTGGGPWTRSTRHGCDREDGGADQHDGAARGQAPCSRRGESEHDGHDADESADRERPDPRARDEPRRGDRQHHERGDEEHAHDPVAATIVTAVSTASRALSAADGEAHHAGGLLVERDREPGPMGHCDDRDDGHTDRDDRPQVAGRTVRIEPNRYGTTLTVSPLVAARLASTAPPAMPAVEEQCEREIARGRPAPAATRR